MIRPNKRGLRTNLEIPPYENERMLEFSVLGGLRSRIEIAPLAEARCADARRRSKVRDGPDDRPQ